MTEFLIRCLQHNKSDVMTAVFYTAIIVKFITQQALSSLFLLLFTMIFVEMEAYDYLLIIYHLLLAVKLSVEDFSDSVTSQN